MPAYTNYRWEPSNKRKGDKYHYKRDVVWPYMPWRTAPPQIIATVKYYDDSSSPYWGRWRVTFESQSPALAALRHWQEVPKLYKRDEAMAWAVAIITLNT